MSKKRVFVSVETTEEEKESFSEAVRQDGKSVSDAIRDFMRDYAGRRSLVKKEVDLTRKNIEEVNTRVDRIEKMIVSLVRELTA